MPSPGDSHVGYGHDGCDAESAGSKLSRGLQEEPLNGFGDQDGVQRACAMRRKRDPARLLTELSEGRGGCSLEAGRISVGSPSSSPHKGRLCQMVSPAELLLLIVLLLSKPHFPMHCLKDYAAQLALSSESC